MSTLAAPDLPTAGSRTTRRILLIWQEPESRLLVKVGELEAGLGDNFTFRYLPAARNPPRFSPLAQFPDLDHVYETDGLPEFFANRVMSRRRENYDEYISWLGLSDPAEPVEVLVRTGGSRATDTFHIVDDLHVEAGGSVTSRFFASGIRYVPGADGRLRGLSLGDELLVRDVPHNPQNPKAMLLDAAREEPVGYVPNWLVDDVHDLRGAAKSLRIVVERVNTDAPSHLKLLCRLEAKL